MVHASTFMASFSLILLGRANRWSDDGWMDVDCVAGVAVAVVDVDEDEVEVVFLYSRPADGK